LSSCVSSYSPPDKRLFPILSLLSSHHSSLFRVLDLGAASFFTPWTLRSIFFLDFLVTHTCIVSFDFLRIVLLPFFSSQFRFWPLPPVFSALSMSSNALLRVLFSWLFPSLLLRCLPWKTFLTLSDLLHDLNFCSGLFPSRPRTLSL